MSDMLELIRLSKILLERDGQRLYKAQNSPAIISLETDTTRLWIKRVVTGVTIRLSIYKDNARGFVYDETGAGSSDLIGEWTPLLVPYLSMLRKRLVLDALVGEDV